MNVSDSGNTEFYSYIGDQSRHVQQLISPEVSIDDDINLADCIDASRMVINMNTCWGIVILQINLGMIFSSTRLHDTQSFVTLQNIICEI